jgi:hypothetical protein
MRLEGSCHCGAVSFALDSATPYPYMRCYCSICRKTAGGGGYAINLGGDAASLSVHGEDQISVYRAKQADGADSPLERHFCRHCASALWAWDARWPDLAHPFASAIDTPLPTPPERVHILLDYAPDWALPAEGPDDTRFSEYPEESIDGWHAARGLRLD